MQRVDTGTRRIAILTDTIRRLIHRHATVNLVKIIKKTHAADLANVIQALNENDALILFEMLPTPEVAADVLSEMEESARANFLETLSPERLSTIFQEMSTDDAAQILEEIEDEERKNQILEMMKEEDSDIVEELLSYGENTAGRIMNPDFVALPKATEAGDAIRELRKASETEMVFYVYVTNEDRRLDGVISLRDLVTVPPETILQDIMNTEVVSVEAHEDQEEVARLVARYNLLAIPVVDAERRLIGIVTVDDVVDVMRDEATEDILKMVGTTEEEITAASPLRSIRIRLPWLFVAWFGGVVASRVIQHFHEAIGQITALAAFIPVVVGMGGNIGIQSASITVRGLATNRLESHHILSHVAKETIIGLFLGLLYGVLLGAAGTLLSWGEPDAVQFGVAVGLGMLSSMLLASFLGSFMPLFLHRLGLDPAIAGGPFVTTTIDILGVAAYFLIATAILL